MTEVKTPEEVAELERLNAELKRENAERRTALETFEKKQVKEKADLEQKNLSEAEKAEARISALEAKDEASQAQLKAERIRIAIITEATALGFANPEHAFALVDKSEVVITDGTVSGFEKSLKALVESGALQMKDQKRSDGLGTPGGKGKPATGADQQEAPIVRF